MFKRKKNENIEQDFISYGNESKEQPVKSSFLGTLIQLLSVVILLGVVLFMGMFGYRYWQKEFAATSDSKPQPPVAVTQPQPQIPATKPASPKEKLYTQEEMQAIVTMLMEQMQKVKPEAAVDTETVHPTTHTTTDSGTPRGDTPPADTLADQLADAGSAELEHEDTASMHMLDPKRYASAKATQKTDADTYNKVVVKKRKNSYDDLANLSREIGGIVDTMQKKAKSNYTASIKKEVKTRSREMRVIIVRKGDTLSKIALRAYGSAMAYDTILQANPDLIKNPNHIYVGQRLRVPLAKK